MSVLSPAARPEVRLVTIDADQAGQRIDNFLTRHLKGVPRTRIYRILRKGEVRVNRGRVRPAYRLQAGDEVRIPPVRTGERSQPPPPGARLAWLEPRILFEDEVLLVLNKPSGMAVHGGSGVSFGVIEALRSLRPRCRNLELVHRLDRDTSGCLLLAKRRSALRELHEGFRKGTIEKYYTALVRGGWQGGQRIVNAPLYKTLTGGGERKVAVNPAGKESLTRFTPVQCFQDATLLEARLETGRTHQIRVHAAHIGYPVAGDAKYGDPDFNRKLGEAGLGRLFLHAHRLVFTNPADGKRLELAAPLDADLQNVLKKLGWRG